MKSINCDNNRKNMLYNIQFSKNKFREVSDLSKLNRLCTQQSINNEIVFRFLYIR